MLNGRWDTVAFGTPDEKGEDITCDTVSHVMSSPFASQQQQLSISSSSTWPARCGPEFSRDQHGGLMYSPGRPPPFQGVLCYTCIQVVSVGNRECCCVLVAPATCLSLLIKDMLLFQWDSEGEHYLDEILIHLSYSQSLSDATCHKHLATLWCIYNCSQT